MSKKEVLESVRVPVRVDLSAVEGSAPGNRRAYRITLVSAGRVRAAGGQESNIEIPYAPLKAALSRGMFDNLAVFADHTDWFSYPKTDRLIGVVSEVGGDDLQEKIFGTVRMYDTPFASAAADLFDDILADRDRGDAVPDVGFSLVLYPVWAPRDNYDDPLILKELSHVESVDFVFSPGADGRLVAKLSSHLGVQLPEEVNIMSDEVVVEEKEVNPVLSPAVEDAAAAWAASARAASVAAILAAADLPEHSRVRLSSVAYASPADLEAAISAERDYLAQLAADSVVELDGVPPRDAQIVMGLNGFEELEQAANALVLGVQPPAGVRPLSGLREMYTLLSGDYEMTGRFRGERVQFANVTSGTMAAICANALNKAVVNEMAALPRWWDPVVTKVNFNSLNDARWITLGGVGELPTVAEGASYDEMTWDDLVETSSFVKKGGYLGITLEAIDKDDTYKMQSIPRLMARAAWMTLGKTIAALFTANSGVGPTLSDSYNLFDASHHGNLLTTALSPTQVVVSKTAMMKQTELNSGERLGGLTAPYYWWVPIDLEDKMIEILASEQVYDYALSNAPSGKVNVQAVGAGREARLANARKRVITVPFWTDTNNYMAQADPRLYPSIGLGFRFGETPEVFSVADPKAGLMFTNDVMPVKVRYFFATGPIDYRGLHKSNVA